MYPTCWYRQGRLLLKPSDALEVHVRSRFNRYRERLFKMPDKPTPEVEAPLASAQDASRMAHDVAKAFVRVYRDKAGVSEQDVEVWMEGSRTHAVTW